MNTYVGVWRRSLACPASGKRSRSLPPCFHKEDKITHTHAYMCVQVNQRLSSSTAELPSTASVTAVTSVQDARPPVTDDGRGADLAPHTPRCMR